MDKSRWYAIGGMLISSLLIIALAQTFSQKSRSNAMTSSDKPMAGMALSLEQYCEDTDSSKDKEEATPEQTAQSPQTTETVAADASGQNADNSITDQTQNQKVAVNTQVRTSTEVQTQPVAKKVVATAKPKIKLNLVYDRLGVVKVKNYLNVRKKPSENSKIVGKMTNNSGCHIYSIKKGWAKIVSGKVRGYVKASYLITDAKAEAEAQKVATLRATVNTETLNVRYLPSTKAGVFDQISADEEYTVKKQNLTESYVKKYIAKHIKKSQLKKINMKAMYTDLKNWALISIDNESAFINKDYIKMTYNLNRAVKIKADGSSDSSSNSSNSSRGSSIVSYAMQFLGNRYVYGGTSLTNGTDCSGFTMRIYQHFGYSLPRTSGSQAAATRRVSSGDVRVGDLFFYGSGSVSHVALYIGNGQVIHASNRRDGIKISNAYYRKPLKIGRVMN